MREDRDRDKIALVEGTPPGRRNGGIAAGGILYELLVLELRFLYMLASGRRHNFLVVI